MGDKFDMVKLGNVKGYKIVDMDLVEGCFLFGIV